MNKAIEILNQFEIRPSYQRIAVMDYLLKHRTHATADAIYDDLEIVEADGYKWHKIGENNYIAEVNEYIELIPKQENLILEIIADLEEIIDLLKTLI